MANGGRERDEDRDDGDPATTAAAALATYRSLLDRYRHTLDLMSPRGFEDLDTKLDEAERYAQAVAEDAPPVGPVLDLGTGAGLPGVVVAVRLRPRSVWWVERRRRRAVFLTQVAAHARLVNVHVVEADVRSLAMRSIGPVAAVTAQAVASFAEVAVLTRHLWGGDVLLVSRKGPGWQDEVAELRTVAGTWIEEDERRAGRVVDVEVVRSEPLHTRGSLIALRVRGGSACPSSV
jgi:16S rRNA (guanine527-N7)-methyltransferase